MQSLRLFSTTIATLALLAVATAPAVSAAPACTLHVAANGSDSNPGTQVQPFRTLEKAASVVVPGDVVCVYAGTYASFSLTRSGTAAQPIILRAAPNSTPLITGGGRISLNNVSYVVLDGFRIEQSYIEIYGAQASHNQILNCDISGASGWAVGMYQHAHDNLVKGCRIHDNVKANWPRGTATLNGGYWGTGMSAAHGAYDNTFEENYVYWNHGEALDAYDAAHGTRFIRNVVADNWGANIYVDGSSDVVIEGNLVYLSQEAKNWAGAVDRPWNNNSCGICVSVEEYAEVGQGPRESYRLRITNNVIVNSGGAMILWKNANPWEAGDWTIANNTFVNNDAGLDMRSGVTLSDIVLRNNVVHQGAGGFAVTVALPGAGNALSHNLYFGTAQRFKWGGSETNFAGWLGQSGEGSSQWIDPALSSISSVPPRLWNDPSLPQVPAELPSRLALVAPYLLTASSPAIDGGSLDGAPSVDFAGDPRNDGSPDIGADEHGSAPPQQGTTYYVATNGNDSNPGTEAAPFRTLQRAANAVAAGDTVLVKQGTYPGFWIVDKHGAAGAWIAFRPYPGHVVTLDSYVNNYATTWRPFEVTASSYVEVSGFRMTDSNPAYDQPDYASYSQGLSHDGIKVNGPYAQYAGSSHLRIKDNHVFHIGGMGFLGGEGSQNLELLDNVFEDIGLGKQGYGIYVGGDGHRLAGNTIARAYGYGIHAYGGADAPDNLVIERNVLTDNGRTDYGRGYPCSPGLGDCGVWNPATGIRRGDGIVLWGGSGSIVRNNLIVRSMEFGLHVNAGSATVANNTFYDNAYRGLEVQPNKNAVVRNNISYGSGGEGGFPGDAYVGPGNTQDHNLFAVHPVFVAPGSGNFHLAAGSPAIDAGVAVGGFSNDLDGVERPQGAAWDIGAYEYGAAGPGGPSVSVDGTFPGYSPDVIDDAVVDAYGGTATTWASDSSQAHWILFEFPAPVALDSVTIFWAYNSFQSSLMTSQTVEVQVWNGSGYGTVAVLSHSGTPAASSAVSFAPVTTSRLRLWQPANQGPVTYPTVIWLTEVDYGVAGSVFADGFESGDLSRWSAAAGAAVVNAGRSVDSPSATAALLATGQGNLAPNPSFETDPWADYFTHGTGSFTWDAQVAHSGSRSLKIASTQAPGALARWLSVTERVPGDTGHTYRAAVWLRTANVSEAALLTMNFWDASLNVLANHLSSQSLTGTRDWAQLTVEAAAPANTRYVRVEFRLYGPGTVWADDVELHDNSSAPPTLTALASPSSLLTGQSAAITAETSDSQPGVEVSLATTLGALSSSSCTTDPSGRCSVDLASPSAGTATVTASAPGYSAGSTAVTFQSSQSPCTLYVATTGNDANDGSSVASAFRTLQQAAESVDPGDVVCVRAGSYAGFRILRSGTDGHEIVFRSYAGETAVLDGMLGHVNSHLVFIHAAYVAVEGFDITDTTSYPSDTTVQVGGLTIDDYQAPSHDVRIENNEIHNLTGGGIGPSSGYSSHHVDIVDNHIYDVGLARLGYGIYLSGSDNLVRGNRIHDAYGHGIHVYGGVTARNVLENNLVYHNGRDDYAKGWDWRDCEANGCPYGDGIIDWGGADNIIRNNVVYDNRMSGVLVHSQNNVVVNNTMFGNRGPDSESPGIWVTQNKGVIVRNNLSHGNVNVDQSVGGGNTQDHNSWNLGIGDPWFVNPQAGDFHLQGGSAAINAGTSENAPPIDFEGTPRPQGGGWDVGADEFALDETVFRDGFESGELSAWSAVVSP